MKSSPMFRFPTALLLALTGLSSMLIIAAELPPDPLPEVAVGRIERLANFPSSFVEARHVDVWLPADYSRKKRYRVIYMHDGQVLFDASESSNKQAWNVHLAVDRLVKARQIPDTPIVGIWNNGQFRHSEYFPQKFLSGMPDQQRALWIKEGLQGKPQSDAYLRCATQPDPVHTMLIGSSLDGLISVCAMNEYPRNLVPRLVC